MISEKLLYILTVLSQLSSESHMIASVKLDVTDTRISKCLFYVILINCIKRRRYTYSRKRPLFKIDSTPIQRTVYDIVYF